MILDDLPLNQKEKFLAKIVISKILKHLKSYHDNGERGGGFDDDGSWDGWDDCVSTIEDDLKEELEKLERNEK